MYDITVDGVPEFYANGVLVHNSPTPPGGGMFKVKRVVRVPGHTTLPRFRLVCRFWDKAGTAGGGAYTVGVKMGITPENRLWVLDVIRVRLDSFRREKLIRETARMDGKHVWVGIEQSGGEGGKESAELTTRRLIGYRVKRIRPGRGHGKRGSGKEERAEPLSVQVNAGNMYVLEREWTDSYLDEFAYFPYASFKDQVDATTGGLTVLTQGRRKAGGMGQGVTRDKTSGLETRRNRLRKLVSRRGHTVRR